MTTSAYLILIALPLLFAFSTADHADWISQSLQEQRWKFSRCTNQEQSQLSNKFHYCLEKKLGQNWSARIPKWPITYCKALDRVDDCLDEVLDQFSCITEAEERFFEYVSDFNEDQKRTVCDSAEDIFDRYNPRMCADRENINIHSECFNKIAHKYNWALTFDDGQLCSFFAEFRNCEKSHYTRCNKNVVKYIESYWDIPARQMGCSMQQVTTSTTTTTTTTTTQPTTTQRTTTESTTVRPTTMRVTNATTIRFTTEAILTPTPTIPNNNCSNCNCNNNSCGSALDCVLGSSLVLEALALDQGNGSIDLCRITNSTIVCLKNKINNCHGDSSELKNWLNLMSIAYRLLCDRCLLDPV